MGHEEDRERLIARLRQSVEQTRTAYQEAKKAHKRAKGLRYEYPDSGYAVSQALRRENQMLLDYKTALSRFNRLILDGKLPAEPE